MVRYRGTYADTSANASQGTTTMARRTATGVCVCMHAPARLPASVDVDASRRTHVRRPLSGTRRMHMRRVAAGYQAARATWKHLAAPAAGVRAA